MQFWTVWECNTEPRCILTGQEQSYDSPETGRSILTVWRVIFTVVLNGGCVAAVWVTVWEASCCSYSSWEWHGGRIDCDSSHCGFGPVLFLSPGPCCSSTQIKCTRCCLSTNSVVLEAELSLTLMILCAVYGFSGTTTQQETGDWRGVPRRLSSDTGLIPRAWGQDVGLGDKSYFSMHMSAASIHLASALTFVIQRAFIQKQLCVLRCCCITGSVSP